MTASKEEYEKLGIPYLSFEQHEQMIKDHHFCPDGITAHVYPEINSQWIQRPNGKFRWRDDRKCVLCGREEKGVFLPGCVNSEDRKYKWEEKVFEEAGVKIYSKKCTCTENGCCAMQQPLEDCSDEIKKRFPQ